MFLRAGAVFGLLLGAGSIVGCFWVQGLFLGWFWVQGLFSGKCDFSGGKIVNITNIISNATQLLTSSDLKLPYGPDLQKKKPHFKISESPAIPKF